MIVHNLLLKCMGMLAFTFDLYSITNSWLPCLLDFKNISNNCELRASTLQACILIEYFLYETLNNLLALNGTCYMCVGISKEGRSRNLFIACGPVGITLLLYRQVAVQSESSHDKRLRFPMIASSRTLWYMETV